MNRVRPSRATARRAALVAVGGFGVIALFQALLAAGAPLGEAAWGGASADLSAGERAGSAVAVVVWGAAAWIVLGRAGFWERRWTFPRLFRWGTWFFALASALSAVANFASSSNWERFGWGPLALALAVLCTTVARSAPEADRT